MKYLEQFVLHIINNEKKKKKKNKKKKYCKNKEDYRISVKIIRQINMNEYMFIITLIIIIKNI